MMQLLFKILEQVKTELAHDDELKISAVVAYFHSKCFVVIEQSIDQ